MERARAVLRVGGALAAFGSGFLALFWIPGILLGLFAIAYLADGPRSLEDPRLRLARNRLAVRKLRRGWLDSPRAA
jgi:hypothetical protein